MGKSVDTGKYYQLQPIMFLQAFLVFLISNAEAHIGYYPSLYGQGSMELLSGDFQGRVLPHMAMSWDHYLKLYEVPEDQWDTWKGSNKVTFTMSEDGSGMSVLYDGITEPLEYKFGEETAVELDEAAGGNSKQRMVRNGPTSVMLSINTEDIGVMETKNIVFHPNGVQITSTAFKPSAYMSAHLYEWYDRVDEEGNKKTLTLGWL